MHKTLAKVRVFIEFLAALFEERLGAGARDAALGREADKPRHVKSRPRKR